VRDRKRRARVGEADRSSADTTASGGRRGSLGFVDLRHFASELFAAAVAI
jgi:hypothetical protein